MTAKASSRNGNAASGNGKASRNGKASSGTGKASSGNGKAASSVRTSRGGESRLTDAELNEVLELIRDADSVELKATVPTGAHRATIQGLPMDPVEAQPRQVFFFDTPDLALQRAGLVVRARRIQGGSGDTVIKVRPVVPGELPRSLRKRKGFGVEVDVLPGGFVCSASLKSRPDGLLVRRAVAGKVPLTRLFSRAQRDFFAAYAPEGISFDSLVPLGPTFVLKTRFDAGMGDGKHATTRSLVAEMWLYPDGSRILELSTKARPNRARAAARETVEYLTAHGVDLDGQQQTKTKTALEFYSAQLREAAVPEPA